MDDSSRDTAPSAVHPSTDSSEADYSSSSSQYSLNSEGKFVLSRSKRKMSDDGLQPVDAARYSGRHKVWRRTSKTQRNVAEPLPHFVKLLTWNVDFSTPNAKTRLRAALAHIQNDVLKCKGGERPPPCCILLQEVLREAFRIILDNEWVQQYFIITPRKTEEWPQGAAYGNVTLTARTIPVCAAYSIEYDSHMHRNALLVDLKLSTSPAKEWSKTQQKSRIVTLRVANTHLESLPQGATLRPKQLRAVAEALTETELVGGLVCGDMNAIGPSDNGLTERVGLQDAHEEGEEEEDGYTWGYQPSTEFPPGRLDKILCTPMAGGYTVNQPKRIGLGLKTDKGQWVSDHCGLFTTVRIATA